MSAKNSVVQSSSSSSRPCIYYAFEPEVLLNEVVTLIQAQVSLDEFCRILKPGGKFRVRDKVTGKEY